MNMFRKVIQNGSSVFRRPRTHSLTVVTSRSLSAFPFFPRFQSCSAASIAKQRFHCVNCHSYSTQSPDGDDKDPRLEIKGRVLRVPNPINILRTQWYLFLIKKIVDPHFSIQEFLEGAKQAVGYFTHLLCGGLYEEMANITNSETITEMKKLVQEMSPERKLAMEITTDDIQLADPYICGFSEIDDSHQVELDVFVVAFKSKAHEPLLLEISLRFSQVYTNKVASGWTISQVNHFNVKEIDIPDSS